MRNSQPHPRQRTGDSECSVELVVHIKRQLEQTAGKFVSLNLWNVQREYGMQVEYSMIDELARRGQSRRKANVHNAVHSSYEVDIKESPNVVKMS